MESNNKVDAPTELRQRIETSLHTRTAPEGTTAAKIEGVVKQAGARLWRQLRKRPSLGVALAGGTGLAAAMVVGVGELTIGLALAYGAYQVLREGVSPAKAAQDLLEEVR